jgi:hypothetical protein
MSLVPGVPSTADVIEAAVINPTPSSPLKAMAPSKFPLATLPGVPMVLLKLLEKRNCGDCVVDALYRKAPKDEPGVPVEIFWILGVAGFPA